MKKTLFHTITIKVPSNQLFIGKNGSVSIVQSLTKNNAITKRLGIPSITLQKDEHILHPEIIEDGDVEDYNDVKVRQKKLKMIKKRLEELPKKKLITKEKLKYALSQIPKKPKQEEINKKYDYNFDFSKYYIILYEEDNKVIVCNNMEDVKIKAKEIYKNTNKEKKILILYFNEDEIHKLTVILKTRSITTTGQFKKKGSDFYKLIINYNDYEYKEYGFNSIILSLMIQLFKKLYRSETSEMSITTFIKKFEKGEYKNNLSNELKKINEQWP